MSKASPKVPISIYKSLVQETYLDVYGHVNNAKYLELYEQARWHWLAEAGLTHKDLLVSGVGPVILKVELHFLKELKARQNFEIHTFSQSYKGKIFTLKQDLYLSEIQDKASTATFTGGLFDLKARKLIQPTPQWLELMSVEWAE